MDKDEIIERLLLQITFEGKLFSILYKKIIGAENDNKIDAIRQEMEKLGLIKRMSGQEAYSGDAVILEILGDEINKSGGWVRYKLTQSTEKQKIITTPTINIGTVQQFIGSTVHGDLNQSSDLNDSLNKLNKPTSKNATPIKNKISKYILYPVVVGLILIVVSLVLKYGFGITY